MIKHRRFSRIDLAAGVIVTVFSMAALVGAWEMPRFAERGADPLTVPGLTPGIVSTVMVVLGVSLMLRALLGLAREAVPIEHWPAGAARRTVFTIVAVLTYGFALFGRMPFVVGTTLFIFAFTFLAEAMHPDRRLGLPVTALLSLLLAIVAAFAVRYVFTDLFLVRLPG